jgi:hypothetical protein
MIVTLYEVYDKRALLDPLDTLPLLDRDRDVKEAMASARAWGGVVMKISARITQAYPLKRDIITAQVLFVHTPRPTRAEPRDRITFKDLRGRIRQANHRNLYKKGRR